jgi:glutaredoxin
MKIKVFGMTNCSGCETVKTLLELNGIDFTYIDVMNPENMAQAQDVGVRSVPTTIVNDHVIVGAGQRELQWIRNAVGI